MYGPGRMGYWGGGRMMRGGPGSPALVIGVLFGAFFLFAVAGPWFNFFPFVFLFWMIPFFLVPALGLAARGFGGLLQARAGRAAAEDSRERELLEALARRGELTPAGAALETTLGVSEADRMLSRLANDGHIEVRAREGALGYALWDADRRELTSSG